MTAGTGDAKESSRGIFERSVSRREALKVAGAGTFLLGAGGLLAACGGGDDSSPTPSGGTLRVGLSGGSGASGNLDAHFAFGFPVIVGRLTNLYDSITDRNFEFDMENALAESVEPNADGSEWTVRLKQGLEFHNGKTVTADDLLFTMERVTSPESASAPLYEPYIDLKQSRKLDQRTVRFVATQPLSIFAELFAQYPTAYVVPTDYDPKKPVGTGPFKLKSFTPGQQSVFERFENFWGEQALVDELVITDFADETARVNALIGGEVDAVDAVPFAQTEVVDGAPNASLLVSESELWSPMTMKADAAPFDDVRVRQAMRLIADRQQIIDQALSGQGRLGNDFPGVLAGCFDDSVAQREQNIDEAKSLLKAAGQEDLQVTLATTDFAVGTVDMCNVFAEQAKAAGITVNVDRQEFNTFLDNYGNHAFGIDAAYLAPYLVTASNSIVPDAPYNTTFIDDPEYNDLFAKGLAELDEDKRCEIVKQMQAIDYERGGYLLWGFTNTVDAHSDSVQGLEPDPQGQGFNHLRFNGVSVS